MILSMQVAKSRDEKVTWKKDCERIEHCFVLIVV